MKRAIPIGLNMLLGLVVISGLFFTFPKIRAFLDPAFTDTLPEIVAVINGVAITQEMIKKEVTLSRFNPTHPLPPLTGDNFKQAAEEALNQLLTRQLVLQAAGRQNFVLDEATIEDKVALLFGRKDDEQLKRGLQQVEATYADLAWWVREVITVEEFTINVIMAGAAPEERQQIYNDWLNQQRAAAKIKINLNGEEQPLLALIGEPAPNFTLTSLSGQPVSLANYKGKVILVNFWATWCPSCISELPDYEQVYRRYQGQADEVLILGINLQENQTLIEEYTAGLGLTFPVLMDQDGRVTTRQYQVTGMPASFIIDRQGVIFYRHLGPMTAETLQAKLAELGL